MLINENVRVATLTIANLAAGGAIGTAVATVDICSNFNVAQTTTGQTLTAPNPTDASPGLQLNLTNTGTASFIFAGEVVAVNECVEFVWNGTAYRYKGDTRNGGVTLNPVNLVAGNNTLTHNLNLPTGRFSDVILQIWDATGNQVTSGRRVFASDTANACIYNVTVPVAGVRILIIPLA